MSYDSTRRVKHALRVPWEGRAPAALALRIVVSYDRQRTVSATDSTQQLHSRVPADLAEWTREKARRDGVDISTFIRMLLIRERRSEVVRA